MVKKYSRKDDGEKYISPNFKVREFACKDGSDVILIDDALPRILQKIREYYNKPVTIVSGYRTPAYNKKVGGVTHSQHMKGTAADIIVKGISPAQVFADIDGGRIFGPHAGGLGKYQGFTHVDVRGHKARWNG